ncbi:hypothetical protein IE077_000797 [Cardiosporidium cionae]|uniref:RING-type domain-containing protein n=1 Tax=Cardiosporidium cionae TaxID=476202 RepID=A0ABQ7J6G4_9APIC|nr:hypothetical protein IE077_000797 [Cardiosporidium cionae]|eukprot:KAF8819589.1 hypothetical protein IE077_000797 [Cardiosporidium cionae]
MDEARPLREIEYWCGNPSVELVNGIVKFYDPFPLSASISHQHDGKNESVTEKYIEEVPTTSSTGLFVAIASAVPNYMSPAEFCEFLSPFDQQVLHGPHAEHYLILVLAKFCVITSLVNLFHNKPYNTLEPGTCQLFAVHSLSIASNSNSAEDEDSVTSPIACPSFQRTCSDLVKDDLNSLHEGSTLLQLDDTKNSQQASATCCTLLDTVDDEKVTQNVSDEGISKKKACSPLISAFDNAKNNFMDPVALFLRYESQQYCAICLEKIMPIVTSPAEVDVFQPIDAHASSSTDSNEVSHSFVFPSNFDKIEAAPIGRSTISGTHIGYTTVETSSNPPLSTCLPPISSSTTLESNVDCNLPYSASSLGEKMKQFYPLVPPTSSVSPAADKDDATFLPPYSNSNLAVVHSPSTASLHDASATLSAAPGIPVNVLCGHTFHSLCLRRWCDTSCPVCRYQQHPFEAANCDICGRIVGLRMCLLCGFIGCHGNEMVRPPLSQNVSSLGNQAHRLDTTEYPVEGETLAEEYYRIEAMQSKHSLQHFLDTQHTYALEIYTHRVWDYTREGYVHRLIQNRLDGKMVEVSNPLTEQTLLQDLSLLANPRLRLSSEQPSVALREEIDANSIDRENPCIESPEKRLALYISEFNLILTSQLDNQRDFYEQKMNEVECMYASPTKKERENTLSLMECLSESIVALNAEIEKVCVWERKAQAVTADVEQMTQELKGLISQEMELKMERDALESCRVQMALQHQRIRVKKEAEIISTMQNFTCAVEQYTYFLYTPTLSIALFFTVIATPLVERCGIIYISSVRKGTHHFQFSAASIDLPFRLDFGRFFEHQSFDFLVTSLFSDYQNIQDLETHLKMTQELAGDHETREGTFLIGQRDVKDVRTARNHKRKPRRARERR